MPRPKTKAVEVQYKAAEGSGLTNKGAEMIALFLNKLYPGGATPQEVVEAANRHDAPDELRKQFEWSDRKAAQQYRITQARKILRSISIVFVNKGNEIETRAYHSILPDHEPKKRYIPMQIVFSRPDYTNQVLESSRREMESWIARYENYKKLIPAVKAAKSVLSMIPVAP